MIDDKPAIALLGPAIQNGQGSIAATVAGSLAANGYVVIVTGKGHTATSAATAATGYGGSVCVVTEPDAAPEDGPGQGRTIMIRPSQLQCTEAILEHADALVVLPGDLHALATLLQVWSYGTTTDEPYRPIVLLGEAWPMLIKSLASAANLDQQQRAMVTFATAVDEAVESLRYYIAP